MNNLAYQEDIRDERINGKIVLMSPRPTVNHNFIAGNIFNIFSNYLDGKTCIPFADGTDLYLNENDRYIPDGMIVCNIEKIKINGVYGALDLVIEILSPSSARYDRGQKKEAYEAAGVLEYWIVGPETKTVEVYLLKDKTLVFDNAYSIYPDYLLEKMTDEEKAAVVTAFRCSLYDDLVIPLDKIFKYTF